MTGTDGSTGVTCAHGYDLGHLTDSQRAAIIYNCELGLIHTDGTVSPEGPFPTVQNTSCVVEVPADSDRSQVADLLRRVADQVEEGYVEGYHPRWVLNTPRIDPDITARLEYLRGEIRAMTISYGELSELQGQAEHIDPGDVELLEWAGVSEHPEEES